MQSSPAKPLVLDERETRLIVAVRELKRHRFGYALAKVHEGELTDIEKTFKEKLTK